MCSVVIPVFNSEPILPELIERVHSVLEKGGGQFEVVLVNDDSQDGSWGVIEDLSSRYATITGINLMRNYGQHNALLVGIRKARYDAVVTMDDDLQNPPEEIPKLLAKLDEGFDVVYGKPAREQHGILRDVASKITKFTLQRAMGAETAGGVSAFRAFRTQLREAFEAYRSPFVNIDVLLTWGGSRFCTVSVRHEQRPLGKSNYTMRKLVVHALNMMTGFSIIPLQIASLLGFGLTFFGAGILIYVLLRYVLQGSPVPGFSFLASIIAIFSGAQLFSIGIIGEYLARMHYRMMGKPSYAVKSVVGPKPDDQ